MSESVAYTPPLMGPKCDICRRQGPMSDAPYEGTYEAIRQGWKEHGGGGFWWIVCPACQAKSRQREQPARRETMSSDWLSNPDE